MYKPIRVLYTDLLPYQPIRAFYTDLLPYQPIRAFYTDIIPYQKIRAFYEDLLSIQANQIAPMWTYFPYKPIISSGRSPAGKEIFKIKSLAWSHIAQATIPEVLQLNVLVIARSQIARKQRSELEKEVTNADVS